MNEIFKWYCEKCEHRTTAQGLGEPQATHPYCKLLRDTPAMFGCPVWKKSKMYIEISYERETGK